MKNRFIKRTNNFCLLRNWFLAITFAIILSSGVSLAQVNIADGDVAGLIAAINAANTNPGADIINLAPGGTYTLTAVNNVGNGLPIITSQIIINGNGATIQRSSVTGTPDFRIFNIGSGDLTLSGVTIRGGRNFLGAGGILNLGTLTLINSTITSNTADSWGGGIYSIGTMTLTNTTVSNNSTFGGNFSGGGGGIFNQGTMTLTGTTVSGNTTLGRGGAIYNLDQTTTLINSTISGNTALNGGGIFNRYGTVVLIQVTTTGNIATDQGGGVWNFGGTTRLKNTIVANNSPSDLSGVITSMGHNIISDASGGLTGSGDLNSTNPLLGPLASNGGPTQTHAPLLGSPAINAVPLANLTDANGNPITTDQRGVSRPQGIAGDIGSVEFNVFTITASAGGNGTISPSGVVSVNYGGSQSFAITPNTGYHVADVLVNGSSVGAVTSYTFNNVTANHTISATFAINVYTITASAGANGSISQSGAVSVNHGSNQSFAITPNTGYHVAGVLVNGSSVGAVTSYTFTNVTANHTISATFAINVYTITASAGANGTISPLGVVSVNNGGSQSFSITPNTGYHVADVLVNGSSVGAVTSYTFNNVTANHTISATFAINVYTITASAGANGSISPSGAVSVNHGSNQSFAITPNTGYHVADVLVNGTSVGAVTSYTFNNVTANHTISATFAINVYTITASADANGTISPSGAVSVNHGSNQSFSITPNTGYHVADVLVNGSSVGAVTSYTFTNVTANHTISATFKISSSGMKQAAKNILNPYLTNSDKKIRDAVEKAIKHIDKSLETELWEDANHLTQKGKKVFDEEKKAVKELTDKKFTGQFSVDALAAIDYLLTADQNLAQVSISEVVCSGDPKCVHELQKANEEMTKAANERAQNDYDKAIDHFKKAWEHAQHAMKKVLPKEGVNYFDVPMDYVVNQNYPNPFNPTTTISYQIPEAGYVSLKVYDMLGREVATLVNEYQQPGNFVKTFHGTSLPSGIYFYRLQAGEFQETRKLLLLK